ncbi:MAG TPA: hypothetical protein VF026_31075 [Ktedonobacteraceae bacterium]
MSPWCEREHHFDAPAVPGLGASLQRPIQQRDALAHAPQAEARRSLLVLRRAPLAVVQHGQFYLPLLLIARGEAQQHLGGVRMLANVRQRLLRAAVERQAQVWVQRVRRLFQIERDPGLAAGGFKFRHQLAQLLLQRACRGFVGSERLDGVTDFRQAGFRHLSCLQQFLVQTRIAARFELRGRFQLDREERQRVTKRVVDLAGNPVALADDRKFLHLGAILLQPRVGRCELGVGDILRRVGQREFADDRPVSIDGEKHEWDGHLAADIPVRGDAADREVGTQAEGAGQQHTERPGFDRRHQARRDERQLREPIDVRARQGDELGGAGQAEQGQQPPGMCADLGPSYSDMIDHEPGPIGPREQKQAEQGERLRTQHPGEIAHTDETRDDPGDPPQVPAC